MHKTPRLTGVHAPPLSEAKPSGVPDELPTLCQARSQALVSPSRPSASHRNSRHLEARQVGVAGLCHDLGTVGSVWQAARKFVPECRGHTHAPSATLQSQDDRRDQSGQADAVRISGNQRPTSSAASHVQRMQSDLVASVLIDCRVSSTCLPKSASHHRGCSRSYSGPLS